MKPRDKFSPSDDYLNDNYQPNGGGPSNGEYPPPNGYGPDEYDEFGPPGGPPGSQMQFDPPTQKPTFALGASIVLVFLAIALFVVSKKFPRLDKLKWGSLVSIVLSVVLAVFFFVSDGGKLKSVKSPKLDQDRIIGVREPDITAVSRMLDNDTKKLKGLGINTISLSPQLNILPSGAVEDTPSSEYDLKSAINKTHKAGFQVYLELAPYKSFSWKLDNPSLYNTTLKRLVSKYAKVAGDFDVAYFSPLSDEVTHPDPEKLAKFMSDVLPKIKKSYQGNIVYQKQGLNQESALEIDEDHIMEFEFMITGEGFNIASRYDFYHKRGGNIIFSVDDEAVSVNNFQKGGGLFKEHFSIEKNTWHKGKIVQEGKNISFHFNGEEMYVYEDDQDVFGSYAFMATGSRIKNITIKDKKGNSLIDTDNFASNWASNEGWSIEGNEFVGKVHPENPEQFAGELFLADKLDYSGYDAIAITLWKMGTESSLEDFKSGIGFRIKSAQQQASSFGITQIIVGRFGGTTTISDKIPEYLQEKYGEPMTNWELADTVEAIFLVEDGKTDGLIYDGWETESQGINKIPEVEQVIDRLLK